MIAGLIDRHVIEIDRCIDGEEGKQFKYRCMHYLLSNTALAD